MNDFGGLERSIATLLEARPYSLEPPERRAIRKPVIPRDRMEINVQVSKFIGDFAIVDATVTVNDVEVAGGRLGFAKRVFQALV